MWSCCRSQGQPVGDRSRAMTASKSLMAGERFMRERYRVMELWSGGVLEVRRAGVMEWWSGGETLPNAPTLHYSNTPLLRLLFTVLPGYPDAPPPPAAASWP